MLEPLYEYCDKNNIVCNKTNDQFGLEYTKGDLSEGIPSDCGEYFINFTSTSEFLEGIDWNKEYALLNSFVEGYFPVQHLKELHNEIRNKNYPAKKIIWVTSDLNIEKNYNTWKSNSKFRNDESINVIGLFFWLGILEERLDFSHSWIKNSVNNIEKRDKLFLFLNNKNHSVRGHFFERIEKFDGLDVSFHSFVERGIFLDVKNVFGGIGQKGDNLDNMAYWEGWGLNNLNQYYMNTYFETFCSTDRDEKDGRIFMCDKIAKPLVMGHPFIGLFNPFTLKSLRELGFETFPELFDESYDDEVNIDNRFNMVVKEIKRYVDLWNRDKEEVHNIFSQKNILEKRKHNQNLVLYHNPIYPKLYDKLSVVR